MKKSKIIIDYTRKALLDELERHLGCRIDEVTFWTWVKKGYVTPSSYVNRGTILLPVFYKSDFDGILKTIVELDKIGTIRLKNRNAKNKKRKNTTAN